ncbi:MAG TPA: hypothetical protein PLZ57_07970 [Pseudobdellovibrionaceae bacterium]|nr:hypothetical protein [Pseudobdellovibrionaceae bacterium]
MRQRFFKSLSFRALLMGVATLLGMTASAEPTNSEIREIIPHGEGETPAPQPVAKRQVAQAAKAVATQGHANSKRGMEYPGGRDEDDLRVQEKIAISPRSLDARAVETVTSESEASAEPSGQD